MLTSASEQALEQTIHDTRKTVKRVRTLLRLLRSEPPDEALKRADAALRQASRALAPARDADVSLTTLKALMERRPKRLGRSPGVKRLIERLAMESASAHQDLRATGSDGRAIALLHSARAELGATIATLESLNEQAMLRRGLRRIYKRGRRAMRRARRREDAATMHEWRKRVKDLRYASEALTAERGEGGYMRKLARDADRLGEVLGEEHDLVLLAEQVHTEQWVFKGDRRGHKALSKTIKRRRQRLRREAFERGEALYGPRPKRFLSRVRKSLR